MLQLRVRKRLSETNGVGQLERSEVARAAFATLELPAKPSLLDLITAVERRYGKPLTLRQVPASSLGKGVTGQWQDTPTHGVIDYTAGSRVWQLHVILHELSHIILDHKSHTSAGFVEAGFFQSVGQRKGVSWMFRHAGKPSDHVECVAEDLAYVLADALRDSGADQAGPAERIFGL